MLRASLIILALGCAAWGHTAHAQAASQSPLACNVATSEVADATQARLAFAECTQPTLPDAQSRTPPLIGMLTDPSGEVRAQAAAALARLDTPALPAMLVALEGPDPSAPAAPRRSAYLAWAFSQMPSPPGEQLLTWARTPPTPVAAAFAPVPILPASDETAPPSRWYVLQAVLSERGDAAVTAARLLNDPDPAISARGVEIAQALGPAAAELRELLAERVRMRQDLVAVEAMAAIGPAGLSEVRAWLASGSTPELRAAAARALVDDSRALANLIAAFADDSPKVRAAAAEALGGIQQLDEPGVGLLVDAIAQQAPAAVFAVRLLERVASSSPTLDARAAEVVAIARREAIERPNAALATALLDLLRAADVAAPVEGEALLAAVEAQLQRSRYRSAALLLGLLQASATPADASWNARVEKALAGARLAARDELLTELAGVSRPGAESVLAAELREALGTRRAAELGAATSAGQRAAIEQDYADAQAAAVIGLAKLGEPGRLILTKLARPSGLCSTLVTNAEPFAPGTGSPGAVLADVAITSCLDPKPLAFGAVLAGIEADVAQGWSKTGAVDRALFRLMASPEADALATRLLAAPALPVTDTLLHERCAAAAHDAAVREAIRIQLAKLAWAKVFAALDACPAMFNGAPKLAVALLRRLVEPPAAGDGDPRQGALAATLASQDFDDEGRQAATVALLAMAAAGPPAARGQGFDGLGQLGADGPAVMAALQAGLDDPDPRVARSAAGAALRLADGQIWQAAAGRVAELDLAKSMQPFLERADFRQPPPGRVGGGGGKLSLPEFPWPPPRAGQVVAFDTDPAKSLLGKGDETLGQVLARLERALLRADPNFSWSLWSAPSGMAVMARMEQIQADGKPLPSPGRWMGVRRAPTSLEDYLVRLLTAPPGHYRVVVFVFTDEIAFGAGDKPLPLLSQGGQILPTDLARMRLRDKHAYALVYAFDKPDGGKATPSTLISARNHLHLMGVLSALSTP